MSRTMKILTAVIAVLLAAVLVLIVLSTMTGRTKVETAVQETAAPEVTAAPEMTAVPGTAAPEESAEPAEDSSAVIAEEAAEAEQAAEGMTETEGEESMYEGALAGMSEEDIAAMALAEEEAEHSGLEEMENSAD